MESVNQRRVAKSSLGHERIALWLDGKGDSVSPAPFVGPRVSEPVSDEVGGAGEQRLSVKSPAAA